MDEIFNKHSRNTKNDKLKVNTNTNAKLLLFTNLGNVIKIDSFMIEEVIKDEIELEKIVGKLLKNEKVISIYSVNDFNKEDFVYIFTKNGNIKRTSLAEFALDFLIIQCHKFKNDKDEVVDVEISRGDNSEALIITKKGMAIKFIAGSVNPMGRVASGVTGISLRDEDEVVYGRVFTFINETTTNIDNISLELTSNKKNTSNILLSDIKMQNRAGRGSNIIMLDLDEEVKNIIEK